MSISTTIAAALGHIHRQTHSDYVAVATAAHNVLDSLLARYPRAASLHGLLCQDAEVSALWELANYQTVTKLGYNDHGPIHAHLAGAAAAQLLHLLLAAGHTPDVVASGIGAADDAMAAVVAAGLLHDVGNALSRERQAEYGVVLAQPILARLLPEVYHDPAKAALLKAFILSTIATHSADPAPTTLEAGVVAVADATDMTSGRGKIAFSQGKVDIHSVSAIAIQQVSIKSGNGTYPIVIEVDMTSEAGLFQVEETLVRKLLRTPLRGLVAVRACMIPSQQHDAPRIIDCVSLAEGNLRAQPERSALG